MKYSELNKLILGEEYNIPKPNDKPRNYWTFERCRKEALKYETKSLFEKNNPTAYSKAVKSKWINHICKHMIILWKKIKKEECISASLKCKSRQEFKDNFPSEYRAALNNNFIECFHHLPTKTGRFWTFEKCKDEALKYNHKSDLKRVAPKVYDAIIRNKWVNLFDHMTRSNPHNKKWGKISCMEESLKYNSRGEFAKKSDSAYRASLKNGWLDEFFPKKNKS